MISKYLVSLLALAASASLSLASPLDITWVYPHPGTNLTHETHHAVFNVHGIPKKVANEFARLILVNLDTKPVPEYKSLVDNITFIDGENRIPFPVSKNATSAKSQLILVAGSEIYPGNGFSIL